MTRMLFIISLFLLAGSVSYAQVSHGGQPIDWSVKGKTFTIPAHHLKDLSAQELDPVMNTAYEVGQAFQYGVERQYAVDVLAEGQWETLQNGKKACRFAINSPGAAMLSLQFAEFDLEPGAQLFLYDAERETFLGSFTEANELPTGEWATSVIPGETVVIEYITNTSSSKASRALKVESITHGVLDLFNYGKGGLSKDFWPGYAAASCHNNVVCPIAAGWEQQASSVAMFLRPDGSGCTGTMLNNTNNDGTPYFYLANHCYQPNESQWVFYFNYEAPACIGDTGQTMQTMVGASFRASDFFDDFALVELFNQPPASYNIYLSGWDRSNTLPTLGVSMMHPAFDVKKFAIDYNSPSQGQGAFGTDIWGVGWNSGGIESVASGAPLFDQNKRVIGSISGGGAICTSGASGIASKFAAQWDGVNPNARLRDWLDPSNSVLALDGLGNNTPPPANGVAIPMVMALQGPLNPSDGRMSDALRSWNVLPAGEPYTALGYQHVNGGGGEMADQDMLGTTGLTAPIDWVFVELRDASNLSVVLATRAGMVLANGDVVEPDDFSPLVFNVSAGNYFVGLRHRNHLSVITSNAVAISNGMNTLDFTNNSISMNGGADAMIQLGSKWALWSGDVTGDEQVKYVGTNNDRDAILISVGGNIPTNTAFGYFLEDVNLDAFVKYAGATNDRDPVLINIGGNSPTVIRNGYYP